MIYLHGFASGGTSTKATYLARRLRGYGIELQTPDLNLPDFSTLTITRMLEHTRALLDAAAVPQTVIGSSLGGFVAVNAARKFADRVDRLVLLAPALDFDGAKTRLGASSLEQWKASGEMSVFHYGYGRVVPIQYELYEDAQRYPVMNVEVRVPTLVFQGRRDDAVDPKTVEEWARRRPNVELHMLDDDHQLTASLPVIWEALEKFLQLGR